MLILRPRNRGWLGSRCWSAAVFAAIAGAVPLAAQQGGAQQAHLGFTAGGLAPVGGFANQAGAGWNAGLLLQSGGGERSLGFRIDAGWEQFASKTDASGNEFRNRILSFDFDMLRGFPLSQRVSVYLIAGLGGYNVRSRTTLVQNGALTLEGGANGQAAPVTQTLSGSSTYPGVNAGAGLQLRLGKISTFVEGRFHNIFTRQNDVRMIPVSFGVIL